MARTSLTDPLRIDGVAVASGGPIGITFWPGKRSLSLSGESWERGVELDLAFIGRWAPQAVITLMDLAELIQADVRNVPEPMSAAFPPWFHLPVCDLCAPDTAFEAEWRRVGARMRSILCRVGKVLVHCRGALGSAGTIAARLLVKLGEKPDAAIPAVRAARGQGPIETPEQVAHLLARRPAPEEEGA